MSIRFFTNAPQEEAASVADDHDNLMRMLPALEDFECREHAGD
jgi:hypothetical protein